MKDIYKGLWQNENMRILLILFFLVGCSDPVIPSHLLTNNGGIFYEDGKKKPFKGVSLEYKNEKLFKKNYYQEGMIYKTEEFYTSGNLKRLYLNQDNVLIVSVFSESGEDISSSINEFYYPNGPMYEKGKYVEGKKDGRWEYYNSDQGLQKREYWHEGLALKIKDKKEISFEENMIIDFSVDLSKKKNFTGIVRTKNEETDYTPSYYRFVKIVNGKRSNLEEVYLLGSEKIIFKSTCLDSEDGKFSQEDFHYTESVILLYQCSYERRYYIKPEQIATKANLVNINENTWELRQTDYYYNGNILQERASVSNGYVGNKSNFKEYTVDNSYHENGTLHTKLVLNEGTELYKRFNENGLDISNGEGEGKDLDLMVLYAPEYEDRYLEQGFYKNGLKDGEWITSDGIKSYTYVEGIRNGPFRDYLLESYKEDGCLYQSGNYKDGERHGEWTKYETIPMEDCGKVREVIMYEMGIIVE